MERRKFIKALGLGSAVPTIPLSLCDKHEHNHDKDLEQFKYTSICCSTDGRFFALREDGKVACSRDGVEWKLC